MLYLMFANGLVVTPYTKEMGVAYLLLHNFTTPINIICLVMKSHTSFAKVTKSVRFA